MDETCYEKRIASKKIGDVWIKEKKTKTQGSAKNTIKCAESAESTDITEKIQHTQYSAHSIDSRTRESDTEEEEKQCRICYSYENMYGATNDLISPCACKGTVKYVHRHCLHTWRYKGKMVKDIKVCEQCGYEYTVENEKKAAVAIVCVATVAMVVSLVLAANILIASTADTLRFVADDIACAIAGDTHIESINGSRPVLVCSIGKIAAKKHIQKQKKDKQYVVRTIVMTDGQEHYVSIQKPCVYALRNIHMLNIDDNGVFVSVTAVAIVYTIVKEASIVLLAHIVVALWRVLSAGTVFDWLVYTIVVAYVYAKLTRRIYNYVDSYCTYIVNK